MPLVLVLIIAALISAATWFFEDDRQSLPYDALVILALVDWLLATGVAASVIVTVEFLKLTPLVRSGRSR